jgi:Putative transposase/Transposase zinc-binding domain
MNRPAIELADIVRAAGNDFIDRHRSSLTWPQLKVLRAIQRCRTAALGGHLDGCPECGHQAISYNSCRDRHCPRCQTSARDKWLTERTKELLPVPYAHVVFTIPHQLAVLAQQNKRTLYDLLLRTSAATLLEVAADPRHLGAHIGFLSVLHTWGQNLKHHPHAHCVVPTGGLAFDGSSWIRPREGFFLPVKVLSKVFRGKFVAGLRRAFGAGKLSFHGELKPLSNQHLFRAFVRSLYRVDWVVYSKKPFRGPQHVLQYLARYTHRVAISSHRLLSFRDGQVTFRWKDYAHGNKQKTMTVSVDEFLRRFLTHVLPRGFVRIRFFGFLSSRKRARLLPNCRVLIGTLLPDKAGSASTASRLFACPCCGGAMIIIRRLTVAELSLRLSRPALNDSS